MESDLVIKKCKQPECTINKDDVCLEGFEDTSQCPHFYLIEDAENENRQGTLDTLPENNNISLFNGEELSITETKTITYRYPVNLIYIIGEHDCGKTTILATLFEMFQVGPFYNYKFAGSLTQVGFEKRCFYSRISSGNGVPDTERTKSEEFNYLHLALKTDTDKQHVSHLLMSDISGEKFKRAKNNSDEMTELLMMSHSDTVNYVLDGEKLANPKLRHGAIMDAILFIQKALDVEVFTNKTNLNFIISKWDILHEVTTFDYETNIKNVFMDSFSKRLKSLNFFKIAVRPKSFNNGFKLGHGLIDLLNSWTKTIPQITIPTEYDVLNSDRMIYMYSTTHGE